MKKTFIFMFLILALVMTLVSCGNSQENKSHIVSDWITDAPATCTEAGTKHKECTECGEIISTGVIGVLGHTEVDLIAVAPTCIVDGLTAGKKCSVCDLITVKQQVIKATGHTEADAIIENLVSPTCTLDGSCEEVVKCVECEYEIKRNNKTLPALGHNFVEQICNNCSGTYSSQGLIFEINDDGLGYTLTSVGEFSDESLVIDFYNELPVTEISQNVFKGNTTITKLTIGNSVKYIGLNAFNGCTGLTEVKIGNGVTNISSFAFSGCTGLTSLTIGEGVKTIGNQAFANCTSLNKINLNASSLDDLTSDTLAFYKAGGAGGIRVVVGNKVSKIPAYLFYYKSKDYAPKVTCLEFADNSVCTTIGSYAFFYNASLVTAEFPSSLADIGIYSFYGCSSLESVNMGDKITKIGDFAFAECGQLEQVTVPKSLNYIGSQAFYNCSSLSSVYISDVEAWCSISFVNMQSNPLTYATNLYLDGKLVTELVIPEGVTEIGAYMFYTCVRISSVVIPDTVTSIGEYAFLGCTGLASVEIPDSVIKVGGDAFNGCTGLKSVILSSNMTEISKSLFFNCTNLRSIDIPNGVTRISDYAFYGSGLSSVIIPDSVKTIGYVAFGSSSLTHVTIGENVTYISEGAFNNTSLSTATFKNTEGWWYSKSSSATSGTTISSEKLADNSEAAKLLCWDMFYYHWYRG